MVKRGIIGRIKTEETPKGSAIGFTFRQAKWRRREKLPTINRNSVYIPLSKQQLSRLAGYTNKMHAMAFPEDLPGNSFGYASVLIHPNKKLVIWCDFVPFERKWTSVKSPTGIGIGDLIHYAIVKHLKEQYKDYTISHVHDSVSPERKKQLTRMGIDVKKPYKMCDYRDKVRAYIERVRREKRATGKEERAK